MIVYHGTPFGGQTHEVSRFLQGRHALIPFSNPQDAAVAFDVCQTVICDNGAFTAWKKGEPIEDWSGYYAWCEEWYRHPAFAWAIIPDVIDGDEAANDELLYEWPGHIVGVPVWHLHESFDRLKRLLLWCLSRFSCLCLGSSGEYATPGAPKWMKRMRDAMEIICDDEGRAKVPLHGLRMACNEYTGRFPFASVDSTNVVQNVGLPRFGTYRAPHRWQRAEAIAYRMDALETTPIFNRAVWYPGQEVSGQGQLFTAEIQRTEGFNAE